MRLPRGDSSGPGASGRSREQSGSGERLSLLSSSKDELSPDALGKSVPPWRKEAEEGEEGEEGEEEEEGEEGEEGEEEEEGEEGEDKRWIKVRDTLSCGHNINAVFLFSKQTSVYPPIHPYARAHHTH